MSSSGVNALPVGTHSVIPCSQMAAQPVSSASRRGSETSYFGNLLMPHTCELEELGSDAKSRAPSLCSGSLILWRSLAFDPGALALSSLVLKPSAQAGP